MGIRINFSYLSLGRQERLEHMHKTGRKEDVSFAWLLLKKHWCQELSLMIYCVNVTQLNVFIYITVQNTWVLALVRCLASTSAVHPKIDTR